MSGGWQTLPASSLCFSGLLWGRQRAAIHQPSGFSLPRFRGEVSDCQAQSSQCSAPGVVQPHTVLIWAGLQGYKPVPGLFFAF